MSNEITTPYDRVLIDPNEPLILPDGTAITGRLETFLYALCCLDYDNLPTPLSRIEEFANALITGEIPNIEPQSRSEQFFLAILDGNIDNLPEPQSRSEVLLNKLAVGDFDLTNVDPIQSRYELLLAYLIKNGGVGNLDYVLYEFYQATQTLYNTQEKPVKSAILKGMTLVNTWNKHETHSKSNFILHDDGFMELKPNVLHLDHIQKSTSCLKPNTKYLLIVEVRDNTLPNDIYIQPDNRTYFYNNEKVILYPPKTNGVTKTLLTTISDFSTTREDLRWGVYIQQSQNNVDESERGTVKIRQMLIEYQDGMENWDIPYFEGMQSVKMPVLTTTGKNLFDVYNMSHNNGWHCDKTIESGKIKLTVNDTTGVAYWKTDEIPVKVGKTYSINISKEGMTSYYLLWVNGDKSKQYTNPITITPDIKTISLGLYMNNSAIGNEGTWQIQVEEGSVATTYEPYKSNILTVNEEVELRKVGNVQDELNLLTGELTQRIGEVVLDGSESWFVGAEQGDFYIYTIIPYLDQNYPIISDKIPTSFRELCKGCLSIYSYDWENAICFMPINATDKNNAILELQSYGDIVFQYIKKEKSIKTVDLSVIDQDGNVLPKIKTFNDTTHVNVSSDGILPKVEMEVATYNEEDIANANVMTASMDEIYSVQNELDNTNSIQSEEIDSTMIASTEIYENIL